MNEAKNRQAGQFAGIAYIVLGVLSLLSLLTNLDIFRYIWLWTLVEIASYAYLAVMMLLKRRDALVSIGYGLMTLLYLRNLFVTYGAVNKLMALLLVLASAAMALVCLTEYIPSLKESVKKYWFAPAGCVVVTLIPTFLSALFNWIFNGFPFFRYFVVTVFSSIITSGLMAAGMFFAAAWMTQPDKLSFSGSSSQPQYQQNPYQTVGQGPRASAAGASYAAPAGGYAAGAGAQQGGGMLPASAYCGLVKHILLLLFTFGIWYLIWIYRTTDNLNCLDDEPPRNPATKLLLCMFVPFYSIYWVYKSAQRIDRLSAMAGQSSDSATLYLILAILIGIVPPILMQDKINSLAAPQGMPHAAQGGTYTAPQQPQPRVQQTPPQAAPYTTPQRPQASAADVVEELKKYKELLDMGAITQEEYDAKKKQLLGL